GRSSHDLDTIDVVSREMAEVERTARCIYRHSVDQHFGVAAFPATEEERRQSTERTALNERGAWDFAQRVRQPSNAACAQIVRSGRSSHDLDTIDVVSREMAEVERTARCIYRHSVDQHFGVAAFPATEEERRQSTERTALNERGAWDFAQRVRQPSNAACAQIV